MTIEAEFLELMPNTATVYSVASRTGYGEVTYSTTGTVVRGHFKRDFKMIRTKDGEERMSSAQFWTYGSIGVLTTDKVVTPDNEQRLILSVVRRYDESGDAHHEVIYFE